MQMSKKTVRPFGQLCSFTCRVPFHACHISIGPSLGLGLNGSKFPTEFESYPPDANAVVEYFLLIQHLLAPRTLRPTIFSFRVVLSSPRRSFICQSFSDRGLVGGTPSHHLL